jgi:hypothetical protein
MSSCSSGEGALSSSSHSCALPGQLGVSAAAASGPCGNPGAAERAPRGQTCPPCGSSPAAASQHPSPWHRTDVAARVWHEHDRTVLPPAGKLTRKALSSDVRPGRPGASRSQSGSARLPCRRTRDAVQCRHAWSRKQTPAMLEAHRAVPAARLPPVLPVVVALQAPEPAQPRSASFTRLQRQVHGYLRVASAALQVAAGVPALEKAQRMLLRMLLGHSIRPSPFRNCTLVGGLQATHTS